MDSANPFASLYQGIFGPYFFAAVLSTGLYGASCMQTFFYYVHYPNDSLAMRLFVGVVWAFNSIASALTIAGVYKYIIATLLNPVAITQLIPELLLETVWSTLVAISVQAFFSYRIYIFGGKHIAVPILWALQAIYQLVASILFVAKELYSSNGHIYSEPYGTVHGAFFKDIVLATISVTAGVDVLIAIGMTYLLLRQRALAGVKGSVHILQRLTVFAVNTGIWTATFAVLAVIFLVTLPATNVLYVVFAVPLPSLYCNALLANLNARAYIRGEVVTQDFLAVSGPTSTSSSGPLTRNSARVVPLTPINIRRGTESETYMENDKAPVLELSSV